MKRCPKCGRDLPLERWGKNRSKPNGLQSYCKECMVQAALRSNRTEVGRERRLRRRLGPSGLADHYRSRGAPAHDAEVFARAICNPYSRCGICGVPARMLSHYHQKNLPVPSRRSHRWRLEVDRIRPGGAYTLENTRLLCPGCNALRGAAVKSDGHVLAIQRKRWEKTLPIAHLWFLNTIPGAGGTPFRGKKHRMEDECAISSS